MNCRGVAVDNLLNVTLHLRKVMLSAEDDDICNASGLSTNDVVLMTSNIDPPSAVRTRRLLSSLKVLPTISLRQRNTVEQATPIVAFELLLTLSPLMATPLLVILAAAMTIVSITNRESIWKLHDKTLMLTSALVRVVNPISSTVLLNDAALLSSQTTLFGHWSIVDGATPMDATPRKRGAIRKLDELEITTSSMYKAANCDEPDFISTACGTITSMTLRLIIVVWYT
jgi:hypothetical protein